MLLVPAIQTQGTSPANVQATPGMVVFGTPGGRNGNEGRLQVDGLGVGAARNGGGVSGYNADIANAQEISFTVSAGLGEAEVSGPSLSVVPKTGGNSLRGSLFLAGVSEGMVGSNYRTAGGGSRHAGRLLKLWDYTAGIGGPIKKDRLVSFLNLRNQDRIHPSRACLRTRTPAIRRNGPIEADTTRQSRAAGSWTVASLRLTLQATPRNKFNIYWDEQKPCTGATYSANDDGCRTQPGKADSSTADRRRRRRKPPPTRIGSSVCSSSRGTRPHQPRAADRRLRRLPHALGRRRDARQPDAQSRARHRAVRAELSAERQHPQPDVSIRELGVALDGAAQLERVDDLRHRRAQHEVRLPGHLLRRRRACYTNDEKVATASTTACRT